MNYQQALRETASYHKLIGRSVNGDEISHLLIVPTGEKHLGELIDRLLRFKSSHNIYEKFDDFEIVVLYEIESFKYSGILIKDKLDNVKRKLNLK